MSQPPQEDKFKNIVFRFQDPPTHSPMHASHIVPPTHSPTPAPRPSTPTVQNHSPAPARQIRVEMLPVSREQKAPLPISSSPRSGGQIVHNQGGSSAREAAIMWRMERQLEQKDQIISELKSIIKLTHENNLKSQAHSAQLSGSPSRSQDDGKEIRDLRHNVKILTIENNALSDYIDKIKREIESKNSDSGLRYLQQSFNQSISSQNSEPHIESIERLVAQNERLGRLLREKEVNYERRLDELATSQKSMAIECKRLEGERMQLEANNERMAVTIKEMEQQSTWREKPSITKIKEQYAESLRQAQETLRIQFEHQLEGYERKIVEMNNRVTQLESRVIGLEVQLQTLDGPLKNNRKKSEIYIEQAQSQKDPSEGQRYKEKPFAPASQADLTKPLQQEVSRLKMTIMQLETRLGERSSSSYTFRQREGDESQQERSSIREELLRVRGESERQQRRLTEEIDSLRGELDDLQRAYKTEKGDYLSMMEAKQQIIKGLTEQLTEMTKKYEQAVSESKSKEAHQPQMIELKKALEVEAARLASELSKYKQAYSQLWVDMKSASKVAAQLKRQVEQMREEGQLSQQMVASLGKQNKQLTTANQELKSNYEESCRKWRQLQQESIISRQKVQQLKREKEEIAQRLAFSQNIVRMLEEEKRALKEAEAQLGEEKGRLEKQLVGYLGIFNKLQHPKSAQELPSAPNQLLQTISELEGALGKADSSQQRLLEGVRGAGGL